MNRRQWMTLSGVAATAGAVSVQAQGDAQPDTPDRFLLKEYRPVSIYKIPITAINKAKFPIIDAHCQPARTASEVNDMVKLMDAAGVERAVIFTGASTREDFDQVRQKYANYPDRFDLWCGFDLNGLPDPGKPLNWCRALGARGVGEVTDKGTGIVDNGPHLDDPRMDPLWDLCGRLAMPVNIHVSAPIWSYRPMDKTNDGLMNGYTQMIEQKPGVLGHEELIASLQRAVSNHPNTTFIASHLMNLDYDLSLLGTILDRNTNLYTDIAARFGEIAPTPRSAARFLEKYQARVLYGTDIPYSERMLSATFRILETQDEHFYAQDLFDYHWPLHGLGLKDEVLRKVYSDNARSIFDRAR